MTLKSLQDYEIIKTNSDMGIFPVFVSLIPSMTVGKHRALFDKIIYCVFSHRSLSNKIVYYICATKYKKE